MRPFKILFLTLKIFSSTGGIEKVCRIVGKVLNDYTLNENGLFSVYSMYDNIIPVKSNKYFPSRVFKSFNKNKFLFGIKSITNGKKMDLVLISHVNLLFFGYFIKLISPSTKLVLFAHGIEIWKPFSNRKKFWLNSCDTIICVSNYTKQRVLDLHHVDGAKCVVVNNCLDPYLPNIIKKEKDQNLLEKYKIKKNCILLLTLSRLSAHDRDKGYEKVIIAVSELKKDYPQIVYMIAGKYEPAEKQWLDNLIAEHCISDSVIFTGYIDDENLADHFQLADIYLMPSTKEGFGIVFVEALYYGLPAIGGNKDGSVDALEKFGLLVDPDQQDEITNALKEVIENKEKYIPAQQEVMKKFGYDAYKRNLLNALNLN